MVDVINLVDYEIRPLVKALRDAGIDTDWSCSGESGHMVVRPTIQARILLARWDEIEKQKKIIEQVLSSNGHKDYWLSLTWGHGANNTHGGEPVWHIQLPGKFDFLALPVAYSARYLAE